MMKNMKQFVAWLVLLSMLLGSFAFGEELVPAEAAMLAETVVEVPVEEAPVEEEALIEETSVEETPVEAEALIEEAPAIETAAIEAAAAHEHVADENGYMCKFESHEFFCDICHELIEEKHVASYVSQNGASGHAAIFEKCGSEYDNIEHTFPCTIFNKAPEDADETCFICDFPFSKIGEHGFFAEHVGAPDENGVCDYCKPDDYDGHMHNCWIEEESRDNYVDQGNGTCALTCLECGEVLEIADHWMYCNRPGVCGGCLTPVDPDTIWTMHEFMDRETNRENWVTLEDGSVVLQCIYCGYWENDDPENCKHWLYQQDENGNPFWKDNGDGSHILCCADCGYVLEQFAHTFVNGLCTECGAADEEAACTHDRTFCYALDDYTHVWECFYCEEQVSEIQRHVFQGNWCVDCGLANVCEHPDYIWVSNGDGTHSSFCADCGVPGGATWECFAHCSDPTVCRDCGAPYTGDEAPGHSYAGNCIDLGNGRHVMECRACGKRDFEEEHLIYCWDKGSSVCSDCGAAYSGGNVGHETWNGEDDNWVSGSDWQHLLICVECGEKLYETAEDHTFENGYCTKCGARNKCRHKSSWGFNHEDNGDGTHSKICNDCKEVVAIEPHEENVIFCKCGAQLGECDHSATTGTNLGNGKHALSCYYCGLAMGEEEHYTYCWTSSNYCSGCHVEVENIRKTHNYLCVNDYDGYGTHVMECRDCREIDEATREAHSYDANGVCTLCGFELNDHYCSSNCDRPYVCTQCGQACEEISHNSEYVDYDIKINEYLHGSYCSKCDVYFGQSKHYVVCSNGSYCSEKYGCGEKVDLDFVEVEHNSWDAPKPDPKNPDYHYFTCMHCGKKITELHTVSCTDTDTTCYCGAFVEQGKRHYSVATYEKPVVHPADASMHGWVCGCGEVLYPSDHQFKNGVCVDCGMETTGVTAVEFYPSEMTVPAGSEESVGLLITGTPFKIDYKSSNTKIASIDEYGMIDAKKAGTVTISVLVSGSDGSSVSAKMKLTVQAVPSKITLSEKKLSLGMGESKTLAATLSPKNAYDALSWSSSDASIVSVDENGKITAVGEGNATVTAETINGKTASCTVSVLAAPAEIMLDVSEVSLVVKKTATLKAEAVSASGNACAGELAFDSSDPSVVTVDAKGKLSAKKLGEATVTVSTYNGLVKEVKVAVFNAPKKVTLDLTKASVNKGETLQLSAAIGEGEYSAFSWSTSAKKVATVDENGLVTAIAEGTATITVKTDNNKKATCKLTVVDPYKPTKITLAETGTVMLSLGEILQLNAAMEPATARSELSWSSKSSKIATVDANGVVTPVKEGTTTITVKTENKKTATVKVQVVDPKKAAAVELSQSGTIELSLGATLQLEAAVLPATAETILSWSTSSKKVATVDENGLVTAVKKGTATITVKTDNGKKDTVKIKVIDAIAPSSIELEDG